MDFVAKIVEVEKRKSGERGGVYIRGCLGLF